MKETMKARDQKRLDVIRLFMAAIKQREVDERISLDDTQVLEVIGKMIKQRKESVAQYQSAGREDLVKQENFEIELLQTYLPAAMNDNELNTILASVIKTIGATSIKDIGKVMAEVKPKVQGRADMSEVSAKIKALLDG